MTDQVDLIEKLIIILRPLISDSFDKDHEYDRKNLNERLAKLSGGVAVIKVGADTEIERIEKQERLRQAVAGVLST